MYSIFDIKALKEQFSLANIKQKHVNSVYRHVIKHRTFDFENIKNFPLEAVKLLKDFGILSKVIDRKDASDKSTTKLVILMRNGKKIESVIMRYGDVDLRNYKNKSEKSDINDTKDTNSTTSRFKSNRRATVCVSSQVGCAMGCKFCATGTMGLLENLSTSDILEQLYLAKGIEQIRNVVFMGMGEPLDNYENVLNAVKFMTDPGMFSLSPSKVTISTVGVVPKIYRMVEDLPEVCLALSLHAPDQETREKIVPTAKNWKLDQLIECVDTFAIQQNEILESENLIKSITRPLNKLPKDNSNREANRRRRVLLEYVLLGDVNSTTIHAHKLGKLLEGKKYFMVNLIPYNPTSAGDLYGYFPPIQSVIDEFVTIVRKYGVVVTIRQELGQDVNAACGQLVVGDKECGDRDIEDFGKDFKNEKKGVRIRGFRKQRVKSQPQPVPASKSNNRKIMTLLLIAITLFLLRILWKFIQQIP